MAVAPDLEALVREELREPVAALVRKLVPEPVAEHLNGHADLAALVAAAAPQRAEESPRAVEATPARGETATGLRACKACGQEKPPEEFPPGRRICRAYRSRQEGERTRRKRTAAASGNGDPEG